MGATEMTITKTHFEMSDDSGAMEPKECLAIDGSAQAQVYAGSGYSAEREQTLQEGDNFTHYVQQAVVLFPSAKQAGAFFTASAQQWPACRQYTHTQSGSLWDVGPISNTNSTLSTTATQQNANAPGWACGRALAHRNNVLIDVNTCSANPANSARYCQDLWMGLFQATSVSVDSAVSAGVMSTGRSSSLPLWNTAPARTRATRCGALTARQRACAASISL